MQARILSVCATVLLCLHFSHGFSWARASRGVVDACPLGFDTYPAARDAVRCEKYCKPRAFFGPSPWRHHDLVPISPQCALAANGTAFRVWAPHATAAFLNGTFASGGGAMQTVAMEQESDGYWFVNVASAAPGDTYTFVFTTQQGNNITRLDPLAREVVESSNPSEPWSASQVHDPAFDWGDSNYTLPGHYELVIYELQIPTLNPAPGSAFGTFSDAVKKLDYIQHLGANVIEPIPVVEYPGDPRGWGYNPGLPVVIESAFGGYTALKSFVKECNARGIGVFMDVVFNHMGSPNGLWQYDGWSEAQPGFPGGVPGGIYYYQDADADTEWGPRPNYADGNVTAFLTHSMAVFSGECHVSGFRWDSVICIRKGGTECWNMPDDNDEGIAFLQEATTATRDLYGAFHIAEDLQNNASVSLPVSAGGMGFDAQWSDTSYYMLHDVLASPDDSTRSMDEYAQVISATYGGGGGGGWRVLYTENHDKTSGQGTDQGRWPNIVDASDPTSYIAQKLSVLGVATVLTSPGVPLLFYGQEFLDHQDFTFGAVPNLDWSQVGEYSSGRWSSIGPFNGIFNLTRVLCRLRTNADGVTGDLISTATNTYHISDENNVVAFSRGEQQSTVVVINASGVAFGSGYNVGAPLPGQWTVRVNTDLKEYSSVFGDVGAGVGTIDANGPAMHGFAQSMTLPLGAYTAVVLTH